LPELTFAFDEALALYLGRRFFEPLAGTYLWDAAQSAFRKVQACLGRQALAYLDKMCDRLHQTAGGASDYAGKGELVDALLQAIEERKTVLGYYQSLRSTECVEYELHPYGLAWHRGSLYLVAYSRDHDAVRHFKVDRFERVEPGNFPFAMPADFTLADHLASSFGVYQGHEDLEIRVRFAAGGPARYVSEGRWHPSQTLTPQKDGGLVAEFRLSSTEELKRWMLSFGAGAEVLEPQALRLELAEEAQRIAALYQPSKRPARGRAR
jgi:proteasome accessory factor B